MGEQSVAGDIMAKIPSTFDDITVNGFTEIALIKFFLSLEHS